MKKFISTLLAVSLTIFLCACTSITYTDTTNVPKIDNDYGPYKQVLITNYGYYLFNCIPLGSGGVTDGSFELFSNNVNVDKAMQSLKDECEKIGAKNFSNLQVSDSSTCIFGWVPYIGTTLGLYWFKEVQLSAVVYSDKFEKESTAQ